MGVEEHIARYETYLDSVKAEVKKGFVKPFHNVAKRENVNPALMHSFLTESEDVNRDDKKAMLGQVYSRVSQGDIATLTKLVQVTQEPILARALELIEGAQGISQQQFEQGFNLDNLAGSRHFEDFGYPAILMDLVTENQGLLEKLDPIHVRRPDLLFKPEEYKVDVQTLRTIAQGIKRRVPDWIADFSVIDQYIIPTPGKTVPNGFSRNSEENFCLPQREGYTWHRRFTADERNAAFNELFSDHEKRGEVYRSLLACMRHVSGTTLKKGYDKKVFDTLPMGLGLSKSEFGFYRVALENFGLNQLLYAFQETEGKQVSRTAVTRAFQLEPEIKGEELLVHRKGKLYGNLETERFNLDSAMQPTIPQIAAACYRVRKYDQAANRILKTLS